MLPIIAVAIVIDWCMERKARILLTALIRYRLRTYLTTLQSLKISSSDAMTSS